MIKAPLGKEGPLLPRLGYGAMVLVSYYDSAHEGDAIDTLSPADGKLVICFCYNPGRNTC